jgi:hypothetical protein
MQTYAIYKVNDYEQVYLGDVQSDSKQDALSIASDMYLVPSWDLLAVLERAEMYHCKYCGQYHPIASKEWLCPLAPK